MQVVSMPRQLNSTRRADGRLVKTLTVDGKRLYFYGESEAEILTKILRYQKAQERGRTFGDVLDEWQQWHEEAVGVGTQRAYKAPINLAKSRFGSIPIREITAKQIKEYLAELARKQYSIKTIKKYYTIPHSVLEYAAENGYVDSNVSAAVSMPSFAKKSAPRNEASPEDIRRVIEYKDKWLLPMFLLRTGLRKGEALGLQYKDISKENRTINIYKEVAYKYNTPYIKEPKTPHGIRVVPLLDDIAELIPDGKPDDFIFSGEKPMTMMVYQRRWAKFQRETGAACTAHNLRHSYASTLYESGIDEKQAQELLGHADITTTMNIYTHIRDSKRKSATDILNKWISEHDG